MACIWLVCSRAPDVTYGGGEKLGRTRVRVCSAARARPIYEALVLLFTLLILRSRCSSFLTYINGISLSFWIMN